jgi:Reverse transcriptase (RNA-dependent DNA polymerase)
VWLVTQGFSQIGGVDYNDTCAPVARLASSHTIIAMANCLRLNLHQVNIKGVYLNGILNNNEVLYMQHPPGYKAPDAGTQVHVCKGELTITTVHVDDCTIAATCICLIEELKASLYQHVEIIDLRELHWMLSIEIKYDHEASTIHLLQCTYIDAILHHYNFADLKPLSTPMDVQVRLSSEQAPVSTAECAIMCNMPYHKAVGALNWAVLSTCPDIAFAVMTVAHFTSNPGPVHWEAIKQIFCYLVGTCDLWLLYGKSKCTLEGYTNANGSMAKDRHAITGYAFLIDGSTVSWSSK